MKIKPFLTACLLLTIASAGASLGSDRNTSGAPHGRPATPHAQARAAAPAAGTGVFTSGAAFSQTGLKNAGSPPSRADSKRKARATFAGGCFWCVEADFEKVDGVIEAVSGYAGGGKADPTYEEVSSGTTGHVESVQVVYDPDTVSYPELLEVFWKHVDPTDAGGQFVDRGFQYRTVIFYEDQKQKSLAEESRRRLAGSGVFDRPIVTQIKELGGFYEAETYHQDYYKKNPIRYRFYRFNSGRDQFLEKVWKERDVDLSGNTREGSFKKAFRKPSDSELRSRLKPLQYKVTQEDATEPPFQNEYWDNKAEGIYVDIVSGEPLFSSTDKFKSGTGWPSFTKPLEPENVVEREDRSFFSVRTEVRSRQADSHLGHVFSDGPPPGGLRYCINSAALRFVPKERLEEKGYGSYLGLFSRSHRSP